MKKPLLLICCAAVMSSCFPSRDIQVDLMDAQLIRIDTVQRVNETRLMLVWKAANDLQFVSYGSPSNNYTVGERMSVFVRH